MMAFVVGARGHACLVASTPHEATSALATFHADAVIYDWNTRGGPLRGLAATFRAFKHVRAVIVTSTLDEPPQFSADEGVDSYFAKPVVMKEVVDRLELVVRSRRG